MLSSIEQRKSLVGYFKALAYSTVIDGLFINLLKITNQ
jgi:hypothetical protein